MTVWQRAAVFVKRAYSDLVRRFATGFDEDVPFGARGEQGRHVRVVLVGLGVVVAIVVAIAVGAAVKGPSTPAFTVETGSSGEVEEASEQVSGTITVYVTGCVAHPGVYELPDGSRMVDAVEAAGGMTEDAATDEINLAATIGDGEKLSVPALSDEGAQVDGSSGASEGASTSSAGGGGTVSGQATSASAIDASGRVNINKATVEELETVSGIGPATAQKIVDERTANGPFTSVDDLTRVSGIGEKRLANMRDHLTV